MTRLVTLLLVLAAPAAVVRADGLIPGPGEEGHDPALASLADAFDRQIHGIMTVPLGWGLEAFVSREEDRATVEAFLASGERDFAAATGRHPYEVLRAYGEEGDLGMFGGVQAAGDAFRYAVLRDGGADPAVVEEARRDLVRAMDGLHWYLQVTGEPGVFARGIRRVVPQDGEPPLPGDIPETVPLFDAAGAPQPADKEPTWREDNSGELPFLIWLDDTSKDQAMGYVFALGAVYDVVAEDPTIPRDRVDRLVSDARAIAERLMRVVAVNERVSIDLVLMDADGRPTTFHDLSAEEITPGATLPGMRPANGFNGLAALGIVRTLFHITGDEAIGRFYYDDLIDARGYLDVVADTVSLMYAGTATNYSNVNMAFVSAYGVLRYESDMLIGLEMRAILHDRLYAPGVAREARGLGQSFFDFVYAGFRVGGSESFGRTAIEEGARTLRETIAPPYWNPSVINCDDAEIDAGSCLAVDGATEIALADTLGRGMSIVAADPVPMRLRPPSNFEWRSDPHRVNGGGGDRLNPGGGWHGAYWMGRFLQRGVSGFENVSPIARERPAIIRTDAGPAADAQDAQDAGPPGDASADAGATGGGGSGCGCAAAAPADAGWLALLGLWALRRRR